MAAAQRTDPYLQFRFRVEIDSVTVAGFSEASGLAVEMETEDYREGGVNEFVHKLRKAVTFPNLILRRGIVDSDALFKWQQDVGQQHKKIQRRTVHITLLDSEGKEKVSWRCLRAHPVKWSGPELKADAASVALETLELVHCGIERA